MLNRLGEAKQIDWDEELVDAVESIKRPGRGRPSRRPKKLHADKAYDDKKCKGALRRRGIKSRIATKGIESSQEVGSTPVGCGAHAGLAFEVL